MDFDLPRQDQLTEANTVARLAICATLVPMDHGTKRAAYLLEVIPTDQAGLYNPWVERCPYDSEENGPALRRQHLARHLDTTPDWILVGEAPGFAGARYSGIAFTSEKLLLAGTIPRVPRPPHRLSTREPPFSEPSATIVWGTLFELGIAEKTVTWNALQCHPYRPRHPHTNRTPTKDELSKGRAALTRLREVFPRAKFIAVGRHAESLIVEAGLRAHAAVRHPANGGATLFRDGLRAIAGQGASN